MIPGPSNKLLRQEANSALVSCGHSNSIFTPYAFKCSDLFVRQLLKKLRFSHLPPLLKFCLLLYKEPCGTYRMSKNQQKGISQVLHAYPESFYFSPYVPQASASNSTRSGLAQW